MNPWDRQPDEPTLWFSRFEAYRLAGPGRTFEATYREDGKGQKKAAEITGAWRKAAEKYQWRERAAAWDMAQIERRRADDEEAYRRRLQQHQDNAIKLGQVTLNNAIRVLALIDKRLATLDAEEIPQKLIPGYLRAAAAVAEAALNGEAQALAVDELLRALDNDQHSE